MRDVLLGSFLACFAVGSSACTDPPGSLALTLTLPSQADLRPTGMTTVTVNATLPGESPISTTSVLVDNSFTAGDLPVATDVQVGVVLRDVSNRIVGVGEAGQTIEIESTATTQLSIPVRRPFIYAATGTSLVAFDPTLDPRDDKFQTTVSGVGMPLFMISVGGDRLAVVTATHVLVVVTATNTVTGMIAIPSKPNDAAAIPGTHEIAVAHATGITIVDLDAGSVATAAVGPVDRVTAGPSADGTLYAYGLVDRIAPPELPPPLGTCAGMSSMVAVSVDAPSVVAAKTLGGAVSDLAAAPDTSQVFATLPCAGQVAKVVGDPLGEIGALTLTKIADVERAAVLTVAGSRVWAAGTKSAVPFCENGASTCGAQSVVSCAAGGTNDVLYADVGASLIVSSIPLAGGDAIQLIAPPRRETIIDAADAAGQHAQVLKPMTVVPLDLVTLPGGQYVSVVAKSTYYIAALAQGANVILPCLDAVSSDWLLFDLAAANVAQRVRTYCNVLATPATAFFDEWACEVPPEAETSIMAYQPSSIGALFGSR